MRTIRWTLIAVLVLGAIAWGVQRLQRPRVEPGSALVFELSGHYVEAPDPPLFAQLLGLHRHSLLSTLSELRKAERDARIGHVVLVVRDLQIGWAKAQELRGAIRALHDAGRHPVAYLEVGGFGANLEYYVASAADELYLAPGGGAPLLGLASENLFLGGLWERLGVGVDVAQAGKYKGAAESLVGRVPTDAFREQAADLLDQIDGQFVSGIAQGRGVSEDAVRQVIALAPSKPETLEAQGMIDGVATRWQLLEKLGKPPELEQEDYAAVDPADVGFDPQATFALVYGSGAVVAGEGTSSRTGEPVLAAETVTKALEQAAEDEAVRAIVLRIDSPGGGSFPSELLWQAVRRARERKPVVASFSDYAASGGYYLSAAADALVSQPGTLTGSIGVFAVRPSLGGLLARYDVNTETLTRAPHAELNLMTSALSADTVEWLQADVRGVYDRFLARVAEGRHLEVAQVEPIAQGRVWTGAEALERRLVDRLGGLRDAVALAKERAGLAADEDVALQIYPPPRPLAEQLREALRTHVARAVAPALPWAGEGWPPALARLGGFLESLASGGPLLVPPIWVEIH